MSALAWVLVSGSLSLDVKVKNEHHVLWVESDCRECDSSELWVDGKLVGFGAGKFAVPRRENRVRVIVKGFKKTRINKNGFTIDSVIWQTDTVIPRKSPYFADPLLRKIQDSLNAVRLHYPIPMMAADSSLTAAAQSHANYLFANWNFYKEYSADTPLCMHNEIKGKQGFTGKHCWDRAERFGYPEEMLVSEVIGFPYDPLHAIAGWLSTLYHRLALLDPDYFEMGFGFCDELEDGSYGVSVMNPGGYELSYPYAEPFFVVYPYPDQIRVPTIMSPEVPDPAPDLREEGFPITVQVPRAFKDRIKVIDILLYDENMEQVKARFLFSGNDKYLGKNEYASLPEKPLKPLQTYTVRVVYELDGNPGETSWKFTTSAFW
jgi:uncharacterized protein YkwD